MPFTIPSGSGTLLRAGTEIKPSNLTNPFSQFDDCRQLFVSPVVYKGGTIVIHFTPSILPD